MHHILPVASSYSRHHKGAYWVPFIPHGTIKEANCPLPSTKRGLQYILGYISKNYEKIFHAFKGQKDKRYLHSINPFIYDCKVGSIAFASTFHIYSLEE